MNLFRDPGKQIACPNCGVMIGLRQKTLDFHTEIDCPKCGMHIGV